MSSGMEQGKPGVLLYFEMMPILEELSDTQIAQLVRAIFFYGRDGVLPTFEDTTLRALWPLMQRRVEYDDEVYRRKSEVRRRAALKRWGKDMEEDANASFAMQNMPTPTPTTTTTTTISTSTTPTARARSAQNCEKNAWMKEYIRRARESVDAYPVKDEENTALCKPQADK